MLPSEEAKSKDEKPDIYTKSSSSNRMSDKAAKPKFSDFLKIQEPVPIPIPIIREQPEEQMGTPIKRQASKIQNTRIRSLKKQNTSSYNDYRFSRLGSSPKPV